MDIAVIGISYHTAPVNIREKVSFTQSKKIEILNYLLDKGIEEVIILSTCNRSETYIATKNLEEQIPIILDFYQSFLAVENAERYIWVKQQEEAIQHLYEVTAGLDSLVLGEDQILGQVKDALQMGMDVGASKKILNKLFREAVTTGKTIKTRLKISEYPTSISYIAMKFLKKQLGTLKDKKVLLVGLGKMNQLSLKYLQEEEVSKIYIANRNRKKAEAIGIEDSRIIPIAYEERYGALEHVDCVITCTAAPHIVFEKDKMPICTNPLYMIDMALPRDVEEGVCKLPFIHLSNMDDFEAIEDENLERRKQLAKEAEAIIVEEMEAFAVWNRTLEVDPTIRSLQQRCFEIQQDTMHYIETKVVLSCKEKKLIDKMIGSSLKRLLREPIHHLKTIQDVEKQSAYQKMMEELFGLEDDGI